MDLVLSRSLTEWISIFAFSLNVRFIITISIIRYKYEKSKTDLQTHRTGEAAATPVLHSFQSRCLTAVDLDLHFPILGLGNEPFFQKRIIEVIQPHPLDNVPFFYFVFLICTLSHDVHLRTRL